jgi:amidase/aspartyl-tRNA(Asn)/glutamyl-tRNA(Gln) amidotransferase subunit A
MPDDVCFLSATEMARRIREGELSPVAAVEACLERIEERNDAVNAFVTRLDDSARLEARRAEQQLVDGEELGPLHGVPVAIKDLFDYVAGVRNTFGCRALESFVPPESVLYVERLRSAGAILIGKTNTPEFGHKGITDNLLFGPTSTPFDLTRNAGGSSGGSAAAVADGMVPLAQGSDAGGSIRIPAAHCGVVGFKPSVGRVAAAFRPDGFLHTPCLHAGPITRTIEDAALMASVMCGPDEGDPLSLPDDGIDWLGALDRDPSCLRVAFSPDLGGFPVDPCVSSVLEEAVVSLEGAGMATDRIALDLGATHERITDLWLEQMAELYAGTVDNIAAAGTDLLGGFRQE